MKLEIIGPGLAFWRVRKHGWDRWAYGIALTVPDAWRWGLGVRLLDFNMAPGLHFDRADLLWLRLGPVEFSVYVEDRKN